MLHLNGRPCICLHNTYNSVNLQLPKFSGVGKKSYTSEPQVWFVLDHVSENKKNKNIKCFFILLKI